MSNGVLVPSTVDKMAAFCESFGKVGTVTKAAVAADISRETVRKWEREDINGFREQLRDAQAAYQDYLEGLALTRVENPEGNRGSDTLLIALNNANNPDKWRGNQASIVVEDSVLQALVMLQALDTSGRDAKGQPAPDPGNVVEGSVVVEKLPWEK